MQERNLPRGNTNVLFSEINLKKIKSASFATVKTQYFIRVGRKIVLRCFDISMNINMYQGLLRLPVTTLYPTFSFFILYIC